MTTSSKTTLVKKNNYPLELGVKKKKKKSPKSAHEKVSKMKTAINEWYGLNLPNMWAVVVFIFFIMVSNHTARIN